MTKQIVDLTNCDREPIHVPGAVQPHGVMVVCEGKEFRITHVSENTDRVFGLPPADLIGQSVSVLFPEDEADQRVHLLSRDVIDTKPVYLFTVGVRGAVKSFDAIAHRNGPYLFLEFEPSAGKRDHSAPELYRLVQQSINQLQKSNSVDELCNICAKQIREIGGFDRVMTYQFDADWNGHVRAESKREDLEPFLGLHYPASDIPQQARELYTRNWLRFIADRDYVPALIVPEVGPEAEEPLDMSFSVLRSVSPIHLEYLRNMGVYASMSVSLVRENRLWGLIACHHYSPRFVPYDVRTACELLGQMMSLTIATAEDRERKEYRDSMKQTIAKMMVNLDKTTDTAVALTEQSPNILDFVQSDGAAVVVGEQVLRLGQSPGEDFVRKLSRWILDSPHGAVYATDHLAGEFGSAVWDNVAAGVLAISLTTSRPHLCLWFRTEQIRTVDWAGDPAKTVVKGNGDVRLSPRGSFSLWRETLRGRSQSWDEAEIESAELLRNEMVGQLIRRAERLQLTHEGLLAASEDLENELVRERAARNESERLNRMKDEFVATLSHELRTPLNAILGWANLLNRQTTLSGQTMEGLQVIERNARSQAQMIEDLLDVSRIISGKLRLDLEDTYLPDIVNSAIETVGLSASAKNVRIEKLIDPLVGVQTTGDPHRLQQIAWNLLSNAVKFTPSGGKVQVFLQRVDSHVELIVSDTGKGIDPAFLPHVFDRFRQAESSSTRNYGGLGLGLSIVRNLVELHGGNVRANSAGENQGSTFTVSLPVRAVFESEQSGQEDGEQSSNDSDIDSLNLNGIRILYVDDEEDARNLIQHILTDTKCTVRTAGSASEALPLLESDEFDAIVSDIGMPGADGYTFIRNWRIREQELGMKKVPAVALTAYARGEDRQRALLAGFQAHLIKPVDRGELLVLLASMTGRL